MPDDPASPADAPGPGGEQDRSQEEFAELRELLLKPERSQIDGL
jgi:hypothetical protein